VTKRSDQHRTLPVAWGLFAAFGLLVLLTCVGFLWLLGVLRAGQDREASRQLIARSQDRTEVELRRLLDPIDRAVREAEEWTRRGLVRRYDSAALKALFLPQLRRLPQSCSMMVADEAGYEFLILRNLGPVGLLDTPPEAGRWVTRDFRRSEWGRRSEWTLWDEGGDVAVRRWERDLDYDPRLRDWHAAPRRLLREGAPERVHWTGVDTFFTSKTPGITASIAAADPAGDVVVIGYDLLFSDLSAFTQRVRPSENGKVFVYTDAGELVGLPRDERFEAPEDAAAAILEPVAAVGPEELAAAIEVWEEREGGAAAPTRVEAGGEAWWVASRPFDVGPERRLWIGVAVPESDLLVSPAERSAVLAIALLGMLASIALAYLLARSFARPLQGLAAQSDRIAALDYSPGRRAPSRLAEVDRLSLALDRMRAALSDHDVALREAKERAEDATEAKSSFLANMSHEIRTPLHAVLGFSHLLKTDELRPDQRECVTAIRQSGEALLGIVNDVLDFSKIEAGKLDLAAAPFAPAACVEDAVAIVAHKAAAKGLTLAVQIAPEVPERVRGDGVRLRQVLVNLLDNAVKFTAEGGVELSLAAGPPADGALVLRAAVADSGPGVAPDRLADLFDPFVQVDGSATRAHGGTGLGLAICRRLCEAMGGAIRAESAPGVGSTFQVSVRVGVVGAGDGAEAPADGPRAAAADADPAPSRPTADPDPDPDPAADGGLRVLVAEDNRVNRRLARRMLEALGHRVDTAADGREACAAVEAADYDVVLMDLQMPEVDGLTAARRIRVARPDGRPRIVAMTADATSAQRAASIGAGMDDYVTKPVGPEALRAVLAGRRPVASE